MIRLALPLVLVALSCAARSEPRERVTPPPLVSVPADAPAPAVDVAVDVPVLVPIDAPADAADRPMTPRNVFPVLELQPEGSGSRLMIGAGSALGVNKSWKRTFLIRKDGTRVPRAELTITFVGERTTRATSTRSPDELRDPKLQAHLAP